MTKRKFLAKIKIAYDRVDTFFTPSVIRCIFCIQFNSMGINNNNLQSLYAFWQSWCRIIEFIALDDLFLHFLKEMVFCYQNCSGLQWEKIGLEFQKNFWNLRLKAENLQNFEIIRTIHSQSGRSDQFLVTEWFFNLFLGVSHIN